MSSAGTGASMFNMPVKRHVDNYRSTDITGRNPKQSEGCQEPGCSGPPDVLAANRWWCVDHIDQHLCCGSKLSPAQKRWILDRPERAEWFEAVAERQAAEEAARLAIKPDPVEIASGTFSWKEHQLRQHQRQQAGDIYDRDPRSQP